MPDFLRLTFNGGRFTGHAAPVEMLKEFSTVELLIMRVARSLYLQEHPGRSNVARGFYDAATLYITATEDNCFSATLGRLGTTEAVEDAVGDVFASARDICLEALAAVAANQPIPANFPKDEVRLLAEIGRRLGGDEDLVLGEGGVSARINQETRARLAATTHNPLFQFKTMEAEIVHVEDEPKRRYVMRTRDGKRYEARYTLTERPLVVETYGLRPIRRLMARVLMQDDKVLNVEDLEPIEDERAPYVQKMWERLKSFINLPEGWAEGEGSSIDAELVASVSNILARLLVENTAIPDPAVFATPDGGVQAEWVTDNWSIDLCFDNDGAVRGGSTHRQGKEVSREFESQIANIDNIADVAEWLSSHFQVPGV